jgi:hypothetical protein
MALENKHKKSFLLFLCFGIINSYGAGSSCGTFSLDLATVETS